MRVIPPITVTDAMLTSSTVPETDYTAWSSGTTYAAEAYVRVVSANYHKVFQSVQNSNQNHDPVTDDGTWWVEIGPTNRWKMFDLLRSTGTAATSVITVVITPGQRVDSIGLVGLVGTDVAIGETVGGGGVYSYSASLNTRPTSTWYEYFFGAFSFKTALVRVDLPPISTAVITVTVVNSGGGAVEIGGVVLGMSVYLGATQYDATSDALNFSTVTRDFAGNATMVQRRTVPKTNQRVVCTKDNVPKVIAVRTSLDAVPALWSGIDDADHAYFEPLLILGFYRAFPVAIDGPEHATINLELEEV